MLAFSPSFVRLMKYDVHVALIRPSENIPSQVSKDCPPATYRKLVHRSNHHSE